MVCSKCGNQLEDDSLFCTECGSAVGVIENPSEPDKTMNGNEFVRKINTFISTVGEGKINLYLSIITVAFMLAVRVLGFIITAVLVTAVNGYLIYCNYKKNSKIDTKIIVCSIAVLLVGLLISL